jgi:hypothetical protein
MCCTPLSAACVLVFSSPQTGFDTKWASKGLWGEGIYFATNSSYSHSYAYVAEGVRQLFLAEVLVGQPFDFKSISKQDLKMPPAKAAQPAEGKAAMHAVDYHDSVTCIHAGSKNFIIYDNGRAYPTYLLDYTVEP